MKINLIYWSGTGNTEAMADLISKGAGNKGAQVTLKTVDTASAADVDTCDILVLGCPSMGAEVLEESEFEPFMESIDSKISNKKIALFGSYDWGDGEWMRNWEERVKSAGAHLITGGLIVNLTPEGEEADKCVHFGEEIVEKVMLEVK